jgi:translation initiation factor IF-3
MAYTDVGKEILLNFADKVSDVGIIDKKPKLEGRNMVMFLSPKKD